MQIVPELKTFFIAMSPIIELRGSIPIALKIYGLPIWSAFLFSIVGNLVPAAIILWLLEPVSNFLRMRWRIFEKFFNWLFARTERKHRQKFAKWEKFALVVLVAIPLPFTGAWTGALCAFLFAIKFQQAFPLITIGVIIAGIIVSLISLGVFQFI